MYIHTPAHLGDEARHPFWRARTASCERCQCRVRVDVGAQAHEVRVREVHTGTYQSKPGKEYIVRNVGLEAPPSALSLQGATRPATLTLSVRVLYSIFLVCCRVWRRSEGRSWWSAQRTVTLHSRLARCPYGRRWQGRPIYSPITRSHMRVSLSTCSTMYVTPSYGLSPRSPAAADLRTSAI
jgi:hypothetical protein